MLKYDLRLLKTVSVMYIKNVKFSVKESKVFNSVFKELHTTTIKHFYSKIANIKTHIDIIVLDLTNNKNLEIIDQLYTFGIPILLLTDSSDNEFILEAYKRGIKSYLKKPVMVNNIIKEIEKIINEYKNQEKLKLFAQNLIQSNKEYKEKLEDLTTLQKQCIYKKGIYEKILDKYVISITTDSKGKVLSFSKKLFYLLGYKDDIIGSNIEIILDKKNSQTKSFQKLMLEAIYKKSSVTQKCNLLTADGKKTIFFEVFLTFEYNNEQLIDKFYFYFDLEI